MQLPEKYQNFDFSGERPSWRSWNLESLADSVEIIPDSTHCHIII